MSDQASTPTPPTPPVPHPKLRDLDVLVGEWRLEGSDSTGQPFTGSVKRAWLDGGFFLTQQTGIEGQPHDGIEYIGYDSATDSLRSMLFSSEGPGPFCPFALEYFWEVDGDTLTIWHGEKGSPAKFVGTIDPAAATVRGAWEWPGGGYQVDATRVTSGEVER